MSEDHILDFEAAFLIDLGDPTLSPGTRNALQSQARAYAERRVAAYHPLVDAVREWQEAELAYDTMDRNRVEYPSIEMKRFYDRKAAAEKVLATLSLPETTP